MPIKRDSPEWRECEEGARRNLAEWDKTQSYPAVEFKAHINDPIGAIRARDERIAELEAALGDLLYTLEHNWHAGDRIVARERAKLVLHSIKL